MRGIKAGLLVMAVAGRRSQPVAAAATPRARRRRRRRGRPCRLSSPTANAEVSGPVTAEVEIDGFTINGANVGKAPVAGEGHLHFEMDGGTYDFPKYSGANGELAVTLNVDGKYSPSVAPTITYSNLPMGEHTLKVFLVDNVHVNTGPMAETTFTVE